VDLYVNISRPAEISETTITTDIRLRSSPKRMANARMKITHEVLVIVYNETVMNSKLQFEKPMSSADETPVSAVRFHDRDQGSGTLPDPDQNRRMYLIAAASRYFTIRWQRTTDNGNGNPVINHF
jgi:hypothetical protein